MQLHQEEPPAKRQAGDRLKNHKLSLTCVCIDSKNRHAFTGSKDGSIIKWCLQTRKMLAKVNSISKKDCELSKSSQQTHHTRHINCMAISSDDKFLATGGWDKHIRIWSPENLTWIHTFTSHRQEVTALAFRLGHPMLYSGSADRSVMLWTLEDDDNRCFVEALYGHESTITSMDALRKERVLSSGGRDQTIRVWKIVEQAQTVFESKHESVDIARYVDDKTFVTGGEDGAINVWTTMKRSAVLSLPNAHLPTKPVGNGNQGSAGIEDKKGLVYWISALAAFSLKEEKQVKATKKRKIEDADEDVLVARYDDDEEDDEEGDQEESDAGDQDETESKKTPVALIASGSCSSEVHIWKLLRSGSKFELKPHQSFDCPGFVNDIRFTSDGKKVIVACGQEHKFGRWWRLKNSKNCMRVFDVR